MLNCNATITRPGSDAVVLQPMVRAHFTMQQTSPLCNRQGHGIPVRCSDSADSDHMLFIRFLQKQSTSNKIIMQVCALMRCRQEIIPNQDRICCACRCFTCYKGLQNKHVYNVVKSGKKSPPITLSDDSNPERHLG